MIIHRRSLLLGGSAFFASWSSVAACAAAGAVLRPEDFGARGDGATDDTRAIQRCLHEAPEGAVVQLRRGAIYRIDTNYAPTWGSFGGLRLKTSQILDLNGAELRALPSSRPQGSVVQAFRINDWRIVGPGRITGERQIHRGQGGEWGMGISAWSSSGWTIGPGVEVASCWGDGIYVGSAPNGGFCEGFLIDRAGVSNCRRNGISIVAGRNGEIRSPTIRQIRGTAPQGGIDLEPDDPRRPNRNIRISGGTIRDAEVGVYITGGNENVVVTGMDIEADNSGVIIGNDAVNVRIEGNPRIKSLIGGREGAAVRTVANPATIRGLYIRDNGLMGGGAFVVDIVGRQYRDLVVAGNRIEASNRGVQGAVRLGGATFTDNVITLGPSAGKERDFFVHLDGVSHGRNVYRNQSRFNMYAALVRSRDLGGDRYESPSLTRVVQ